MPKILVKFDRVTLNGAPNRGGVGSSFSTNISLFFKNNAIKDIDTMEC